MNAYILLALLCFNLIGIIHADFENKCRVDTNDETLNTGIYCFYLKLDDKDLPLDTPVPPSDYVSLHLINCTGSIDGKSFRNLKDLASISISGSMDKFVLPDLPKLNYIEIDNLQMPILKGAFKYVQDTLTSIKFNDNPFVINNDDLEGLSNLERLILVQQNVTSLEWLKDLKKLTELIIVESNIKTIPKDTFKNNLDLSSIELSNVPLQIIEPGAFDLLTNLKMLLMTTTDLTTFDGNLMKNLKNLQGLGIPARSVKSLDVEKLFQNCPKLGTFYFTERDVKCLETKNLQNEISKQKRLMGIAYSGGTGNYITTC